MSHHITSYYSANNYHHPTESKIQKSKKISTKPDTTHGHSFTTFLSVTHHSHDALTHLDRTIWRSHGVEVRFYCFQTFWTLQYLGMSMSRSIPSHRYTRTREYLHGGCIGYWRSQASHSHPDQDQTRISSSHHLRVWCSTGSCKPQHDLSMTTHQSAQRTTRYQETCCIIISPRLVISSRNVEESDLKSEWREV